jgi:hypothetical protein
LFINLIQEPAPLGLTVRAAKNTDVRVAPDRTFLFGTVRPPADRDTDIFATYHVESHASLAVWTIVKYAMV